MNVNTDNRAVEEVELDEELLEAFELLEKLEPFEKKENIYPFRMGRLPEPQRWNEDGIKHKLV